MEFAQDPRVMFRNMFEEVVCLHDDLCIGIHTLIVEITRYLALRARGIRDDWWIKKWLAVLALSRCGRASAGEGIHARWVVISVEYNASS